MAKKIKRTISNIKKTGKKSNSQEGKEKKNEFGNKDKPSKVKDRNLKFKNKNKKGKLTKKIVQAQKNDRNVAASIVNPEITKVMNKKKKGQTKKGESHSQKVKKQQPDQGKQRLNKKLQGKNKSSDRANNKVNGNKNSTKKGKFNDQKGKSKKEKKLDNKTVKLNSLPEKKVKEKKKKSERKGNDSKNTANSHNLDVQRLQELLATKQKEKKKEKKNAKPQSLRDRMMVRLRSSRFRYLNETLYNNQSSESKQFFKNDPDAFKAYHEGYKQQIEHWPMNPLDVVVSSIKKMPKEHIVADFGCGEAKLAASVPHKVHSFDFVSLNENITVCDVAHTPLLTNGVHVVVFCLSLMGTNLKDYIVEANRVLKKDGVLKIAEVESRFEQVEDFINTMSNYGFKNTWKDLSHNLFYFLDFKKESDITNKRGKLPPITLKPCLYKKR